MYHACSHSGTVPTLQACVGQTFIIAHREPTEFLETTLAQEGLAGTVLRQERQTGDSHAERLRQCPTSPSQLTLCNHRRAWERACQEPNLTLVVEADFVPVQGFGNLPLPCSSTWGQVGLVWLYTCAAQIYSVSDEGVAEGFSTAMVAYLVTPAGARALLEMADQLQQAAAPTDYLPWDSGIDSFLRRRGLKNVIPFRNYGEHGGYPNPEHKGYGLSRVHRADVLWGRLAFMPLYATGGHHENQRPPASFSVRRRYWMARSHARLKGIARLLAGKFLRCKVVRGSRVPMRLLRFAIARQGVWHL